jgi:hypothetical protein
MSNVETHHPMDENYDESCDSFSFYTKSSSEDLYARGSTQNKNEKKKDELSIITYIKGFSWR